MTTQAIVTNFVLQGDFYGQSYNGIQNVAHKIGFLNAPRSAKKIKDLSSIKCHKGDEGHLGRKVFIVSSVGHTIKGAT